MNQIAQQMKVTTKFTELGIPYKIVDGGFDYQVSTTIKKGKSKNVYGVMSDVDDSDHTVNIKIYDECSDDQSVIYELSIEGVKKVEPTPFYGVPELGKVWGRVRYA